jgi:hypothetical protein
MTTQPTIAARRAVERAPGKKAATIASSWRLRVAAILGLALAIRAGLWAVGLASTGYAWRLSRVSLLVWSRWDAPHYLRIAKVGYVAHGPDALWIVFFPIYPLLVHGASLALSNVVISGLLVSLFASVVAALFLYKLAALDSTDDEAWRAVVLLFVFPTALFLSTPYSEGVFLATVLASIYAARTDRWGWSAVAGIAATASRLTGLAVVPALFFEAMRSSGSQRVRRLAYVAVVPFGFLAYLGLNQRVFGNPLHFMTVEKGRPWYQKAVPPWHPVVEAVHVLVTNHKQRTLWSTYPARLAAFVLAVSLLVWGWRRLRASDHAFAWSALAMSLSGARLISLPRYILGLYPIFIVLAYRIRRRAVFWAFVAGSLALQGLLFSRYARGLWAY